MFGANLTTKRRVVANYVAKLVTLIPRRRSADSREKLLDCIGSGI